MAAGICAAGTRRTCFQRLHVDRLAVQVHDILAALLLDVHLPRPLAHAPVLDLAILRRVLVARHLLLAPIIRWRSLPRLLAEVDVPAMARAVGPHGDAYVVRAGIVVEAAETVWERLRGGFEGKVGSMAPSAHSVQKPSRVKPVMAIPFVEHVTSLSPYTFVLSVEPKTPARANCSIERERRGVLSKLVRSGVLSQKYPWRKATEQRDARYRGPHDPRPASLMTCGLTPAG